MDPHKKIGGPHLNRFPTAQDFTASHSGADDPILYAEHQRALRIRVAPASPPLFRLESDRLEGNQAAFGF